MSDALMEACKRIDEQSGLLDRKDAEIAILRKEAEAMSNNLDDWLALRRMVMEFVASRYYADPIWKSDRAIKPLFDYVEALRAKGGES